MAATNHIAPRYDVLGIGIAAVDDVLWVDAWPAPDTKMRVRKRERRCGGLTATALVTAARLGARTGYAAVLGEGEDSRFVLEAVGAAGVDTKPARTLHGAGPGHSMIVVAADRGTRNVFSDVSAVMEPRDAWPDGALVRSARVLFVDHMYPGAAIHAARIAREAGIPVVADLERDTSPRFGELLDLVDHLVVSRSFALRLGGASDPRDAAAGLLRPGRSVIVTCGAEGAWFGGEGVPPSHVPACAVDVLDTTGSGDVFHGAYAAMLSIGLDLRSRAVVASATAALAASRPGGWAAIPGRAEVDAFLGAASPFRVPPCPPA
jgi:sulfofructose kinase